MRHAYQLGFGFCVSADTGFLGLCLESSRPDLVGKGWLFLYAKQNLQSAWVLELQKADGFPLYIENPTLDGPHHVYMSEYTLVPGSHVYSADFPASAAGEDLCVARDAP